MVAYAADLYLVTQLIANNLIGSDCLFLSYSSHIFRKINQNQYIDLKWIEQSTTRYYWHWLATTTSSKVRLCRVCANSNKTNGYICFFLTYTSLTKLNRFFQFLCIVVIWKATCMARHKFCEMLCNLCKFAYKNIWPYILVSYTHFIEAVEGFIWAFFLLLLKGKQVYSDYNKTNHNTDKTYSITSDIQNARAINYPGDLMNSNRLIPQQLVMLTDNNRRKQECGTWYHHLRCQHVCIELKFENCQRHYVILSIRRHREHNCIWKKYCADYYSAAKFKTSNFTTIQHRRQMRCQVVLETESETESWLP